MRPAWLSCPPALRRIALALAALAAVVALAPLLASPAAARGSLPPAAGAGGRRIAYLVPPRVDGLRRRAAGYRPLGSGALTWHNGPVQHHPTQYLLFWGPAWVGANHKLVPAAQLVEEYFADMKGTSFERIVTQYADHTGPIANTDTLAAAVVDMTAPPTDQSCGTQTIQDSAIMQEIAHAGQTLGWPAPGVDDTYFVYTPPRYAINDGAGNCSTQVFCAYHAWSTTTPGFAYAAIPYPSDRGCEAPRSPHRDLVGDSLVSTSSHEQLEAMTDPQVGTGWFDGADFELADKCATDYPSGYIRLNHGARFELQAEYSNASRSCVTSYTPPTPPKHPSSPRR